MGPEGAVSILYGKEIEAIPEPEKKAERRLQRIEEIRERLDASQADATQAIIDPRETRPILVNTLSRLAKKQPPAKPWEKHGLISL
jgi:acetyl-CoA carboxylase carboxyltransferase component